MHKKIILFFATGAGFGYLKKASGTMGSLLGIPLMFVLNALPLSSAVMFLLTFIIFSIWIASQAELYFQEKDSSKIVIDEVCGFLVTIFLVPYSFSTLVLGFALFRLFDIWKPFPISWFERNLKGGFGVVMDDVVAGLFSNLILHILYQRGFL